MNKTINNLEALYNAGILTESEYKEQKNIFHLSTIKNNVIMSKKEDVDIMIKSRKFESQKLAEIFASKVNGSIQVYFESNGFGKRIFEVIYSA